MYLVVLFSLNKSNIAFSYSFIMDVNKYLCVLVYYIYVPQKLHMNDSDNGISSDTITFLLASHKISDFEIFGDCQDKLKGLKSSPLVFLEKYSL